MFKGEQPEKKDESVKVVFGLGVVVVLFVVAYKMGSMTTSSVVGSSASIDNLITELADKTKKCQDDLQKEQQIKPQLVDDAVESYRMQHDLDDQLRKLETDSTTTEKALTMCQTDLQLEQIEYKEYTEEREALINDLTKTIVAAEGHLSRLDTVAEQSLEFNNVMTLLNKLSMRHYQLYADWAGAEKAQFTIDFDYLDHLVMNFSLGASSQRFQQRMGKILPALATEKEDVSDAGSFADVNVDEIETVLFKAQRGSNGEWTKPRYQVPGTSTIYTGNREVSLGTKDAKEVNARLVPTSLPKVMRTLYEYVLCAAGQNVSLSFPDDLVTTEGGAVQNLSSLVVTPHVTFCKNCYQQHHTGAFSLLCLGHTSREQYGSRLFWLVRSKLVPSDVVRNLAREYIKEKIGDAPTLAVRLPKGATWDENCRPKTPEPLMFYKKVLYSDDVRQMSTEQELQCNPTESLVIAGIKEAAEVIEAKQIFLVSEMGDEEAKDLSEKLGLKVLRTGAYDATDAQKSLVDIVIASRSTGILVNRFDLVSTHITEYYMLHNRLNTEKISVW